MRAVFAAALAAVAAVIVEMFNLNRNHSAKTEGVLKSVILEDNLKSQQAETKSANNQEKLDAFVKDFERKFPNSVKSFDNTNGGGRKPS